ncbi:hypothetical protein [Salarchaeum japonicum]|uniref:Cytochrome-ba3 oxidase subunit n=1 Tax=Salarchaeum japonicum TaxID=555573 RepID=A0AAV3T0E4_9EURY|nr:hypothetical protein [Salarchaeum japonicum]
MVEFSRENQVITACAVVALTGWYVVTESTNSDLAAAAVLFGVGILAPLAINGYLDRE